MTAPPSIPVPSCALAFIVLMLPPKLTCTCPAFHGTRKNLTCYCITGRWGGKQQLSTVLT